MIHINRLVNRIGRGLGIRPYTPDSKLNRPHEKSDIIYYIVFN